MGKKENKRITLKRNRNSIANSQEHRQIENDHTIRPSVKNGEISLKNKKYAKTTFGKNRE